MQQHPNPLVSGLHNAYNQIAVSADSWMLRAQNFVNEFSMRMRQPVDTIYEVALQRVTEGAYNDAIYRLKFVVNRRPNHAEAWYHLGSCYMETGRTAEAVEAFRNTLNLNPAMDEARFLIAVLAPDALPVDQQPKFAPLSLAASHFDAQAEFYEDEQLNELGYTGHEAMAASVRKYLNPNYKNFQIMDLGCGTGLVGPLFRDIAGYIVGVDISEAMLYFADQKRDNLARKIYDEVVLDDLRHVLLEGQENSVDLLLAANVCPYLGGLTPVFEGAKRVLKPGGVFAFSFEAIDGNDFGLIPGEGRFAHAHNYVRALVQASGFETLEDYEFEMFHESNAMQYVLRKPVPAQPAAPTQP